MDLTGSTALVTGANRGLGRAFTAALLARGARTVYAAARAPETVEVTDPRLIPVRLDITDPEQVAAAAGLCSDTTLLINNAGILRGGSLLTAPGLEDARAEMETNHFGTLAMCRAFAPVLRKNGGGALVNMLSVLAWHSLPQAGSYGVSKAAAWSMTRAIREELREQGTLVVATHAAFIDTEMAAGVAQPKTGPADVAAQTLDAVEAGREEVLADEITRRVKAGLAG
ncbi:SDR family oxidoreductase [Streptomyces sp. NPDC006460]|uniref:SDR family oxidoreductase n=1 Tax=unclassified Streptomyces TaxID=2593676 RepID=UPI0033B91F38